MRTVEATPRSLWRAWRTRRDAGAFEALVEPELRYAASLARRMGASAQEAEDAVQESLIRLAREKTDDPIRIGVRAWLCRRVVLGHKMQVRAAVRRRTHEASAPPRGSSTPPGRAIELKDRVEAALTGLGREEREAVLLRYINDLDYAEMAYVLGISREACRVRVHRGIKKLRSKLGGKAAALVAALGVPAFTAQAAIVTTAVGTATAGGAGALLGLVTGKVAVKVAAAVLMAGAAATGIVVATSKKKPDPEPTPVAAVVRSEPAPAVVAAPVEAPPTPPPEPAPMHRFASDDRLLDAHFSGEMNATWLMWRFDEVASLIPRPAGEPVRVEGGDGTTDVDLHGLVVRSRRIELGPGTFRLTSGLRNPGGRSVEIRGSGVGKTTLIAPNHSLLTTSGASARLHVSDLTFLAYEKGARRSGDFIDARGRQFAVVERVRFGSWYPWAGTGAPISVTQGGQGLLAFRDCEFVGAYRQSGGGSALGVRGDTVALFDRCRFSDLDETVTEGRPEDVSPRSLVHFLDCEFVNAPLARRSFAWKRDPIFSLRVRRAQVAIGAPALTPKRRRYLWSYGALAEDRDLRWAPGPVRGTLGELKQALAVFSEAPNERLFLIRKVAWPDWEHPGFIVQTLDTINRRRTRLIRLDPATGGLTETREVEFPCSYDLKLDHDDPDLRQKVRGSIDLFPLDTPILGIHLREGDERGPIVNTYPSGSIYFSTTYLKRRGR